MVLDTPVCTVSVSVSFEHYAMSEEHHIRDWCDSDPVKVTQYRTRHCARCMLHVMPPEYDLIRV